MVRGSRKVTGQRGFTYVWVMVSVALLGVALAAVGPAWSYQRDRDREQALLRVGQAYAEAIGSYYRSSPGSRKVYPQSLEDLLIDRRYVTTLRHLRKLYADPLEPSRAWGLVRTPDGGIQGVYSLDGRSPWNRTVLDLGLTSIGPAERYSDWVFIPHVE